MTAERPLERMGVEEFLLWAETREERYELIDGVPHMMAGAKRGHDRIVVNLVSILSVRLSGHPCEPFTGDTAIVMPNGDVRLPGVGVDCGQASDDDRRAVLPVFVVEILSPSTRDFDQHGKLDEYRSLPSMQSVLLMEVDEPKATLWTRATGGGWRESTLRGLEAMLEVPAIGFTTPLRPLYDRVTFTPKPRPSPRIVT